jgi:hypothetical protein
MLIQIKNLTWDPVIYPRTTQSRQTIDAYAEALAFVGLTRSTIFTKIRLKKALNHTF